MEAREGPPRGIPPLPPRRSTGVPPDGRVPFRHETDGFTQGRDDLAVVHLIVVGQGPAAAIFEPLVAL